MLNDIRRTSLVFLSALAVIIGCVFWYLKLSNNNAFFIPYFSNIHPLLAVLIISIPGILSLYILDSRGWFHIFRRNNVIPGIIYSLLVSPIFAVVAISFDFLFGFPADINVLFPESLFFYPGMAYIVEMAFHAIPLTALMLITSIYFDFPRSRQQAYLCIYLVCLIEPAYQLDFTSSEGSGYVFQILLFIHLFMFNMVQMYLFRRFDFITMYLFRILFYIQWHVIWGELRLGILF